MPSPSPPELIGQSRTWLESLERVSLAAQVERPILVIGERGTGKELIAERLHYLSPRWDKPFVKVNCGSLSADLLDSELFGHEQGAFTGATKRRAGRFEQADTGTLFLDEIATASTEVQEKLLRVVEYGEFQRLGGEDTLTCDVRIVAATNVDLPARAADGRFRADLLDRLAFDVITLAPLRARPEDIVLLAEHFGSRIARELEGDFPGWSREALDAMCAHAWPGNVRELRNAAERATFRTMAAQANGAPLGPVTLSVDLLDPFASPWRPPKDLSDGVPRQAPIPAQQAFVAVDTLEVTASIESAGATPASFNETIEALEKKLIEAALEHCRGHQKKAAEHLGLSYHQMRGLLRKYGYGRDGADETPAIAAEKAK
ncbi:MAG TPA: phage shock protein operon transcriptional activator [Hyphomonadaceae bacterium]|jgi:psp operon transcriptional activator|nr:phage shock protein operon transcriptional activator [Hyphomonadaceae bacterium]